MATSSHPGLTQAYPPPSYPALRSDLALAGVGALSVPPPKPTVSARWLAALVENSSDSIVSVDNRGILQSWNAGAQRLFGYTAGEMLGRRGELLIPPGRTDELEEVLGDDEQFIDSFRFETHRVRKDGSLVEVAVAASRVRDDDGKSLGWALVARDVTESNRLQAELSRAKELMDATFASMGDGVALLDADNKLLMVNDAYAALSTAERRAATDQRLALERLREKLKSAAFPQRRRPVQPRQRSGASRSRPAAASTSPPAHVAPASPPMPPLVQLAEAIAAQRPPSEQPWWILGAAILSID